MKFMLGKKIGMTQYFSDKGERIPVTMISAGPCIVVQKKTKEIDGYNALQLGFGPKKGKNQSKAVINHYEKNKLELNAYLREFRVGNPDEYQIGQKIGVDIFTPGDYVDVSGISKGKGFQGVVKRHNFNGGPATHGQSDRLRAPGSIGSSSFPSRVFKGMRMAGHMGSEKITVQKITVVKVLAEKNILLLKGSVPGCNKGMLIIKETVKSTKRIKEKPIVAVVKKKAKGKAPKKTAA